jgi:hypothetical protein
LSFTQQAPLGLHVQCRNAIAREIKASPAAGAFFYADQRSVDGIETTAYRDHNEK